MGDTDPLNPSSLDKSFLKLWNDEKIFVWGIIRNGFYLSFAKGCELEGIQLIIFATGFTKKISGGNELTTEQWEEVKAFKNSDSIARDNFTAYRSRCKIAFLRLDTDWYESTLKEMQVLWPRVVPGGYVVLDDYLSWQGSKQAVHEVLGPSVNISIIDETSVYIRKDQ